MQNWTQHHSKKNAYREILLRMQANLRLLVKPCFCVTAMSIVMQKGCLTLFRSLLGYYEHRQYLWASSCFEEPQFAVTVQLDNKKNHSISPKIVIQETGTGFSQLVPTIRIGLPH